MNPQQDEQLETAIHRILRKLPDRKAPAGLEERVFAELARRAALPWWRGSFSRWPSLVRAGFFAVSAVSALLLVWAVVTLGASHLATQLAGGLSHSLSWLILARDLGAEIQVSLRILIASIPTVWLVTAAVAVAVSYAVLAALGAATYRALSYVRPSS